MPIDNNDLRSIAIELIELGKAGFQREYDAYRKNSGFSDPRTAIEVMKSELKRDEEAFQAIHAERESLSARSAALDKELAELTREMRKVSAQAHKYENSKDVLDSGMPLIKIRRRRNRESVRDNKVHYDKYQELLQRKIAKEQEKREVSSKLKAAEAREKQYKSDRSSLLNTKDGYVHYRNISLLSKLRNMERHLKLTDGVNVLMSDADFRRLSSDFSERNSVDSLTGALVNALNGATCFETRNGMSPDESIDMLQAAIDKVGYSKFQNDFTPIELCAGYSKYQKIQPDGSVVVDFSEIRDKKVVVRLFVGFCKAVLFPQLRTLFREWTGKRKNEMSLDDNFQQAENYGSRLQTGSSNPLEGMIATWGEAAKRVRRNLPALADKIGDDLVKQIDAAGYHIHWLVKALPARRKSTMLHVVGDVLNRLGDMLAEDSSILSGADIGKCSARVRGIVENALGAESNERVLQIIYKVVWAGCIGAMLREVRNAFLSRAKENGLGSELVIGFLRRIDAKIMEADAGLRNYKTIRFVAINARHICDDAAAILGFCLPKLEDYVEEYESVFSDPVESAERILNESAEKAQSEEDEDEEDTCLEDSEDEDRGEDEDIPAGSESEESDSKEGGKDEPDGGAKDGQDSCKDSSGEDTSGKDGGRSAGAAEKIDFLLDGKRLPDGPKNGKH